MSLLKTKHVLITGGAGYIGSQAASHLLSKGHRVTVFDRVIYGAEQVLAFRNNPDFSLVIGDVRDTAKLTAALQNADAIIHLAAIVGEDACAVDREAAWSINVDGTQSALDAATRSGTAQFIFASTCSNYGVARPGELATEQSELNPLSEYAKAKVVAERLVLTRNELASATVLRFGTICGLSARMRFDLLVSEVARNAALGKPIDIFAPDAWRPFLHVNDAARALELLLNTGPDKIRSKVFNVVGENVQKRGLVELCRRHFPEANVKVTDKKPDLRDYQVDSSYIARELGFTARHTIEDAFLETAEAVGAGVFRDPYWPGHSAVPLAGSFDRI